MKKSRSALLASFFALITTTVLAGCKSGERGEITLDEKKSHMIERHLKGRDITDPRVLAAMARVPRERFVPAHLRDEAYGDYPLPIGLGQTISQPYIVATMSQALALKPDEKVLEIGTGSGYQAAILGELAGEVYSVELICELQQRAAGLLEELKYANVHTRCSDGYAGWSEHAPFDAILLTAAPPEIPQALIDQLRPGGRLLAPVGVVLQRLVMLRKDPDGTIRTETSHDVRFVPMVHGERLPGGQ
ncbi:MAG: protein-L-isoaspartate O-methyltransferase [Deltaproteobacteria bacterium HGW-Deltaproteobacteria-17]|nr:MAG: protein-L-isoaspartate O-methyltransferase [Deltaproteobacteria bacterium HGW-Deltaproteobacteria-17]